MSFRGVFFDLYGTLLAYGDMQAAWSDWLSALYEQLAKGGLLMSREEFAERCDGFFERPRPPAQDDGLTLYERRIQALGIELGLDLGDVALSKAADASIAAWQKHVSIDPDAHAVLGALRTRKTLALVSNFDHPPHVYLLLSELRLARFFDSVVVSGEVGVEKPDPRIFATALAQTGLEPREVIYVGDTAEDVQGALAAGLCPILIRRGELEGEIADFRLEQRSSTVEPIEGVEVVSSLAALVDMLGQKNVRRYGEEESSNE
jgi:putative hydrolase of the HAD superfamily